MKNSTASTLIWLTVILLVLGLLIMSPSGSFFVFVLAALAALAPIFSGSKKIRIAAVLLLSASILLASVKYPEFRKEQKRIEKQSRINH